MLVFAEKGTRAVQHFVQVTSTALDTVRLRADVDKQIVEVEARDLGMHMRMRFEQDLVESFAVCDLNMRCATLSGKGKFLTLDTVERTVDQRQVSGVPHHPHVLTDVQECRVLSQRSEYGPRADTPMLCELHPRAFREIALENCVCAEKTTVVANDTNFELTFHSSDATGGITHTLAYDFASPVRSAATASHKTTSLEISCKHMRMLADIFQSNAIKSHTIQVFRANNDTGLLLWDGCRDVFLYPENI